MNELELAQSLDAIAGAGEIDEQAAWSSIQARLAHDRRAARRRRTSGILAGVAVAAAAAAVVAIAAGDRPEAVDTLPPATSPAGEGTVPATAPATSEPATTAPATIGPAPTGRLHVGPVTNALVAAQGPVPEDAVVLVRGDAAGNQDVEVYDLASGDLAARPVAGTPYRYSSATLGPDGTVWVTEDLGGSTQIIALPWGSVHDLPIDGADGGAIPDGRLPAVSPDGTQLAYVRGDAVFLRDATAACQPASCNELELPTSEDPGTSEITDVDWSPDGTSLLVAHRDGGLDTVGIRDGGRVQATAAVITAVAAAVAPPDLLAVTDEGEVQVTSFDGTGEVTTLPLDGRSAIDIDAAPDGSYAITYADGGVDLFRPDGTVDRLTDATVLHASL